MWVGKFTSPNEDDQINKGDLGTVHRVLDRLEHLILLRDDEISHLRGTVAQLNIELEQKS